MSFYLRRKGQEIGRKSTRASAASAASGPGRSNEKYLRVSVLKQFLQQAVAQIDGGEGVETPF